MADQQTPSHDGIVPPNTKNALNLEDTEISGPKFDLVAQSTYATSSQSQPSSLLDQPHPPQLQAIQQDEEKLLEDDNSVLDNSPPAKRQLRERKPNNLVSANCNGDSVNSNKRARTSPIKPNSSKIFDTKAKIREEITTATQAQRNAFLVEKQNYFIPLLLENNYIQKLITQHANLSEDEKIKLPAFVPYQQLETQPKGIKATLKSYQLSGLSYMVYLYRNGVNGILGDDMGLGKTLQTLSLIQHLKENHPTIGKRRLQRPFLIVCPLSVLGSWVSETEKWTDLRVVRFHGGRDERNRLKHIIAGGIDKLGNLSPQATKKRKRKARLESSEGEVNSSDRDEDNDEDNALGVDLVITTYESYKSEQSWLKAVFVWRYVVLDEGQIIKNHASEVSRSLQGLKAEYRLILSGTPLQNDLGELWALFHFLYPEVFVEKTRDLFAKGFNLSKGDYIKDVLVASRRLLELIMLRRTKTSPGVDLGLPPIEEVLLFVPLTPLQKLWYERLIKKTDTAILHELFDTDSTQEQTTMANLAMESTSSGNNNAKKRTTWQSLMNLVIQLRKVCNHPYQIDDAEPDPYFPGQHLIEASGKFIVLEKLVTELVIEQKKKIIIFSGFTKMLDLVQELLILKGGDGSKFNTCRIDGSTGRSRRNLAIRMFMDLTSNYNVFLISTRAGGLGLNLAAASEILLLDQDWNPQVTKQAIGRAYRIGLQKPLTVYQFVAQGTVEEQMMPRIAKKLYLSAKVTESMEDLYTQPSASSKIKGKEISNGDDTDMPEMNTGQLMTLILRGASAISRPEIDVNKMLEWDWKTTIAMCKDHASDNSSGKNIADDSNVDEEDAEKQWLAERERVQSRLFNGETIEDHRPKSNKHSQDFATSSSKADRRIGKERTVMMDGYMVSKDTINNSQWEAVKTFSSANTTPSVSKREKKPDTKSQAYCQVCKIDHKSPLISCKFCPRAYHNDCLTPCYQEKVKKVQFACPQHLCADCKQKAGDVGGMLYKCRWCQEAQCEDCIDWNGFKPLGDSLPELDLLGFPKTSSAFYIHCKDCSEKLENDGEFKDLCEGLKKQWAKDLKKLNAVDEAVYEKIAEPGSIDMPIFIDDDSDVEDLVEVPATTMARKQDVGATNGLGGHHRHQGARISTSNVPRQAGKSTQGSPFTFPKRQENGRKKSFMDKWTEPPAPPAPHGGLGNSFNAPRRTQQLTSNTPVSTSAMRTLTAGTGMWMVNGQYGYGRHHGQLQATYDPNFSPQFGSNVGAQNKLSNTPRNSPQLDSYYASPQGAYIGGYDSMSNVPRLLGQYTPRAPQHSAPPSEVNPGGLVNVGMSNIPRLAGQLRSDIPPMFATPFRRSVSHQANPGRKRSYMDKWMEAPSGDN